MHRQLIPGYRGQLPLAHQAAILAAGLPSIAIAIVMVETRFNVSAWTAVSAAVAITASTVLPFLVAARPRLAVVLGAVAAGVSAGAIPVLALVGNLGLRIGPRRTPWYVVPLIGSAIAIGFACRHLSGVAPGVLGTTIVTLMGVCLVLGSLRLIMRPRTPQPLAPTVDSDWLSRRIHDGVGHRLALLSLRARIQQSELQAAGPELWQVVADEVESTFEDLRRLLDEIDQGGAVPDDDPGFALDEFIVEARRAGVPVLVSGRHLLDRLDAADVGIIAAVCREGVANAAKYGAPGHVHVRFERQPQGDMTVEVRSPLGAEAPRLSGGGHGLNWLRRQVEHGGGAVFTFVDGEHFVLRARVRTRVTPATDDDTRSWSVDARAVAG